MEKILLVEDDIHVLKSLAKLLRESGYDVETAASGLEAVELAQKDEFCMVITDVRMPGIDGIEALGKIKSYQPDARRLVITGYAGDDAPIRAIHLSVDDYLMKPFPPEKFLESVKTAILKYQSEIKKRELTIFSSILQKIFRTLTQEIETKIPQKEGRSVRMAELGTKLAETAKLEPKRVGRLSILLSFHDLGYLSFSDKEMEDLLSSKHIETGCKIFKAAPEGEMLSSLYEKHHFPFNKSSEMVPVESQILSLCETFENLLSKGLSQKEAFQTLTKDPENFWEPSLLERLEEVLFNPLHKLSEKPSLKTYEILLHLGKTYTLTGEIETGKMALQKLLEQEQKIEDPDFKFRLHFALAQNLIRDQKFSAGEEEACRTLETALSLNLSPLTISSIFLEIILSRLFLSKTEKVEELLEKGRANFEKFGDKRNLARTELYSALFSAMSGNKETAKKHFANCKIIVEEEKIEDFWGSESLALRFREKVPDFLELLNFDPTNTAQEKGVQFYSFGPIRVYRNEAIIPEEEWKSKKGKILLNYLLLNQDRPVSEDKLCDLFWPHGDPERSRKNLHHIIYLLRRTLEPNLKEGGDSQYILSQHNAYQFNKSSNYWWDVHEFRENLQKAQQLWSSGEAEKAIEKIRRLEDLYTGDLLEDNLEETWCDFEREKLKEAFLELLLTAAAFYEEKQEHVMALEFANKALTLDPLREKTAHLLIKLLYKSGKRTEAIRKYQTWCSQLEEEMNLKPSDEFAALYEKMTISSRIS